MSVPASTEELSAQVARRRTFAIISHPDAGKTHADREAAALRRRDRAGRRRAGTQERGATSCPTGWRWSSSAASRSRRGARVRARGCHVTLLDTPGHQDFSEDTYRTLFAVDSVVMVHRRRQGHRGADAQAVRGLPRARLPILTFINKLDQPGRDPFELLDEIERVLGIARRAAELAARRRRPDFRGVFDLRTRTVLLYERDAARASGRRRSNVATITIPSSASIAGDRARARAASRRVEIIARRGHRVRSSRPTWRAGRRRCSSAARSNNFGVEPFLQALIDAGAAARAAHGRTAAPVEPASPDFSGFVFKIQANMNPRHRDRVAFVRVCSGRLARTWR